LAPRRVELIEARQLVLFGLPYDSHLQGGIQAWKAAGLPTISASN
jgi:rhodanese-related sulfurtransferase